MKQELNTNFRKIQKIMKKSLKKLKNNFQKIQKIKKKLKIKKKNLKNPKGRKFKFYKQ